MKRSVTTVPIRKIDGKSVISEQDWVAVEEPVEILVNGRNVAITMRTPGEDRELAVGFVFTEGILRAAPRAISADGNRVDVTVDGEIDLGRLERHVYLSSSCGVCGKVSIDAIQNAGCPMLPADRPRIGRELISRLPDILRARQKAFERSGGLHAAGLFDTDGALIDLKEDVGRHNAVDKLIGAAVLRGMTPLDRHILMLSGRASFELVQKALIAGIAIVAAVGAPSSLAVETALRYGMTLIGFVRGERFNVYSGVQRLGGG